MHWSMFVLSTLELEHLVSNESAMNCGISLLQPMA